jgi:hypothetical protein
MVYKRSLTFLADGALFLLAALADPARDDGEARGHVQEGQVPLPLHRAGHAEAGMKGALTVR